MTIETSKRNSSAAAPIENEKFIEVETKRKYTPQHCYDVESYEAGFDEDRNQPILKYMASIINGDDGKPLKQLDQIVDQRLDKFGDRKPVYKEILDSVPAMTTIALPAQEAARLIKVGVAAPTMNTFR